MSSILDRMSAACATSTCVLARSVGCTENTLRTGVDDLGVAARIVAAAADVVVVSAGVEAVAVDEVGVGGAVVVEDSIISGY
jgi:hypothetical protein